MQDTNHRCGDSDVCANNQFRSCIQDVNTLCTVVGSAKLRTDIAPNFGVRSKGIHEEDEETDEEPRAKERGADVHAVGSPW